MLIVLALCMLYFVLIVPITKTPKATPLPLTWLYSSLKNNHTDFIFDRILTQKPCGLLTEFPLSREYKIPDIFQVFLKLEITIFQVK